jgi:hypothetical protein
MNQTKIPYVINLFGTALQVWRLCPDPSLQIEVLQYMDARLGGFFLAANLNLDKWR